MAFSENLTKLQKDYSITNYRLAKELGVHCTTIQNWRDGKMPQLQHAHAVAEYFKKTMEEMMQ